MQRKHWEFRTTNLWLNATQFGFSQRMLPMPMRSVRHTTVRKESVQRENSNNQNAFLWLNEECVAGRPGQSSRSSPLVSTSVVCRARESQRPRLHGLLGRWLLITKHRSFLCYIILQTCDCSNYPKFTTVTTLSFRFKPRSKTASTWIASWLSFKSDRSQISLFQYGVYIFSLVLLCNFYTQSAFRHNWQISAWFFSFIDQPASMYEDKVQLICKNREKRNLWPKCNRS